MSTPRTFNDMLNEYITNDLMSEALLKRDWFIQNVPKDNGWKGGKIPVPFYGTTASSILLGGLTDENEVSKHKYVRGNIDGYKEAWGTLRFEHGDLIDHDGAVNEKSFLKILPNQLNEFGDTMKEQMSKMLLTGAGIAKVATVVNAAAGIITVDRIDRFVLDQKVELVIAGPTTLVGFVKSINLNTNEISLDTTLAGGVDLDVTGAVAGDVLYFAGGATAGNRFSNLRDSLLSAASVGITNAATVKLGLFNAYNEIRKKARGNANTILMSFKHMGALMASLEDQKGGFKVTARDEKASLYGWTEITITSVRGTLKCVAIQEMDDDVIMFLDMEAVKYYSNGEVIRKRIAPDGKQYYEKRSTSGYFYLLDMAALGELVLHAPTKCGIIYGISYEEI